MSFAARSFRGLDPRTPVLMNCHVELIAAKLVAVRAGWIRRLLVSLPPPSEVAPRLGRLPGLVPRPRAGCGGPCRHPRVLRAKVGAPLSPGARALPTNCPPMSAE